MKGCPKDSPFSFCQYNCRFDNKRCKYLQALKKPMHLGKKIKLARTLMGLSQSQLAEKINKTRTLVSYIEKEGKVHPDTLKQILIGLEMREEELEYLGSRPAKDFEEVKYLKMQNEMLLEQLNHLKELYRLQKDLIELLQQKKG